MNDSKRSVASMEHVLAAHLAPALRVRRPAVPADLGRRALAGRAARGRLPFAAGVILAAAAAATLLWRADTAVVDRPMSSGTIDAPAGGGGEARIARRLERRLRDLRRSARQLAREAALLSRRAAETKEQEEALDRQVDAVGAHLRELRREQTGAAELDRVVDACGDDPLCPLPPGPSLSADPDPGLDFTVERAPEPRPSRPSLDAAAAVKPVSGRLLRCARDVDARAGVLMLTLTVAADGSVSHTRSPLGNRTFGSCVGNAMRRVRFPAPGVETDVAYPLVVPD